jgi:hypothetical protein
MNGLWAIPPTKRHAANEPQARIILNLSPGETQVETRLTCYFRGSSLSNGASEQLKNPPNYATARI